MRIRRKFLQLTSMTYPYGTEKMLEKYLPKGFCRDDYGNYFIKIPRADGTDSDTMFTCHLDTACKEQVVVKHVQTDKYISTNGKSILGADDKAGMVVVLYMIENKVPGLYYFFIGEEVGCIGSGNASKYDSSHIKRCISFDRRDTYSVITHQMYGRCCSDDFAEELSLRLNNAGHGLDMYPDSTGIMTDSASFMEKIPECTNISVGYYDEHTFKEKQDISFLIQLCRSVVNVDWDSLPTKRDPLEQDEEYDYWGAYIRKFDKNRKNVVELPMKSQDDNKSTYIKKVIKGVTTWIKLTSLRIEYEKGLIGRFLEVNGEYMGFDKIKWDGDRCYVVYDQFRISEYIGSRDDLSILIPELECIGMHEFSQFDSSTAVF